MDKALIIRGRFRRGSFRADEPVPDVEGRAELIVYTQTSADKPQPTGSMFDLFGKAQRLRPAQDIDAQILQERRDTGGPIRG